MAKDIVKEVDDVECDDCCEVQEPDDTNYEELYNKLRVEYNRVNDQNQKLNADYNKLVKAFNMLLQEYNNLHVEHLLKKAE